MGTQGELPEAGASASQTHFGETALGAASLLQELGTVSTVSAPSGESLARAPRRLPFTPARLAGVLLVTAILAAWLCSGVTPANGARFMAFEALYVLAPGCTVYLLLSSSPEGRLRTIAIGWPLGYALEVGAFALTAAVHTRVALDYLPLATPLAGALLLSRPAGRMRVRALLAGRRRAGDRAGHSDFVPVAGAMIVAVTLLACTFFAASPLPEHARNVAYREDNVFDITLSAEALHHWPIAESWVAGQPLRYYTGVFIHTAAVDQVMGVPLSTVIFRLLPTTMFLLAGLQLWALGRTVGRSRWIGPLAAVLLLASQDVDLNATQSQVFQIDPYTQFSLSPSFAFGVLFFLGALILIQARLTGPRAAQRAGIVPWLVVLGVLSAGLAASKAFGAFDLVCGLGLYWLWCLARGQGARMAAGALAVSAAAILAVYFLMISGGGSATLGLKPLNFLHEGDTLVLATAAAKDIAGPSLYWLLLLAGGGAIAVCLLAPLLGAAWLMWRKRGVSDSIALLVAVFAVGVGAYVFLGAPGGVEGVFLVYGYIALVPVAAKGLVLLWSETPAYTRRALLRACGVLLGLGLGIAVITPALALSGHARDAWLGLAYGSVVAVIVAAIVRLRRSPHSQPTRVVACLIPLISVLTLIKPLTLAGSGALDTIAGKRTSMADSPGDYGMTAPLYQGLLWVRAHTNPCQVLAVSNHYANAQKDPSVYFYYSAFTERPVFLESWQYTALGQYGAQPYPTRIALNNAATQDGDASALRQLQRDGVSYVLIDKTHGGGAPEPSSVSTLVFSNHALDVYRLRPAPGAGPHPCATAS
jgi:hypothetical protein